MSYIIVPPEIKEMLDQIRPYRKNALCFKEGTPDYILELDKKVQEFYDEATDGLQ